MSLTSWTTEENTKHHDLVRSIGSVGSCDVVEIRPSDDAGGDEECNDSGQEGDIVCHGVHCAVVTSFTLRYTLRVQVEAQDGSGRWTGNFPKQYLEEITRKTGSFKSFDEFKSMLHAALSKRTEMLTVALLTSGDLEELKNQRLSGNKTISRSVGASGSGLGALPSSSSTATQKQNSKRYMILTDAVNGHMVHYPLPLALQITSAICASDLSGLQSTIQSQKKEYEKEIERQSKFCQEKEKEAQLLREENQILQRQLEDAQSLMALEMAKIRSDAEDLRAQLDETEANYELVQSECSKDIPRLNRRPQNERGRRNEKEMGSSPYYKLRAKSSNLELELAEMREKSRKSAARAKYEAEGLKRDVRREEAVSRALRSQVRELQRRIRELEAELKDVDAKMMQKRNKGGGLVASSPRPKARQRRFQTGTTGIRASPYRIGPGTASDSSPGGGSFRNQSHRMCKKEWGGGDSQGRLRSLRSPIRRYPRRVGISPASRTLSPSSSTHSGPVFDPTAYQCQREAHLKDAKLRRKRIEIRGISGGGGTRGCSRDSWIPSDTAFELTPPPHSVPLGFFLKPGCLWTGSDRSVERPFSSPHDRGRRKKRFPMTNKDKDLGYSSAGSQRTGGSAASSPAPRQWMDMRQVRADRSLDKEGSCTAAQRKQHVKHNPIVQKPVAAASALRLFTEDPASALTSSNDNSIGISSKAEELFVAAPEERSPKILQDSSVKNGMLSIDQRLNALQDFLKMAKTGGIH